MYAIRSYYDWDYTKANGLDAIEEELYYAYLGTYTNGQYGFCFGSAAGSSVYTGLLVYQAALIGENQVKLTFVITSYSIHYTKLYEQDLGKT